MKQSKFLGSANLHSRERFRDGLAYGVVALAGLACGCDSARESEHRVANPPTTEVAKIDVAGAATTIGFHFGTLKSDVEQSGFSISRFPTTVAEYRACVEAGVCAGGRRSGAALRRRPEPGRRSQRHARIVGVPVTCVGPEQAQQFWVSGTASGPLTLEEWLLAARGQEPNRYAWGNQRPTLKRASPRPRQRRGRQKTPGTRPPPDSKSANTRKERHLPGWRTCS
jgi:hypothetical protein